MFGLDVRCIRLTPYRYGESLLLDVQHLVPLPEAAELTIHLRRREKVAKASTRDARDWTQYVVVTPDGPTEPLRKRHAIHAMVQALHPLGFSVEQIAEALPNSRFLSVDGNLTDDALEAALVARYGKTSVTLRTRFFVDDPIQEDGRTWVLSNQWGGALADNALAHLAALDPAGRVRAVPAVDTDGCCRPPAGGETRSPVSKSGRASCSSGE